MNLFLRPLSEAPAVDLETHFEREGVEGEVFDFDLPVFSIPKLKLSQHLEPPEEGEIVLSASWEDGYWLNLRNEGRAISVSVITREESTGNSGTTRCNQLWMQGTRIPAPRLKHYVSNLSSFKLQKFELYTGETWHACRFGRSHDPGHTSVRYDALLLRNGVGAWFYIELDDVDYSS